MSKSLNKIIYYLLSLLKSIVFLLVLANDSRIEKERVISALSEMEEAVQKLSHLSFEMSTGSTDL